MVACCVAECMLLLAVLICQYTFFVAYGAVVAAMVPLVAFGSNDLGGELSQSDSFLMHVMGGTIVTEPCICLLGHWFPPHIHFPRLCFNGSSSVARYIMFYSTSCVALVTL